MQEGIVQVRASISEICLTIEQNGRPLALQKIRLPSKRFSFGKQFWPAEYISASPPPPPLVALAAVRPKVVIMLWLIHCLFLLQSCVGTLCLVLVFVM